MDLYEISGAWGGSTTSPAFSVVLLTDEQVEACKINEDFNFSDFAYQISQYGNMKIADTSQTGDYAVYGSDPVNDEYQYFGGVAATVTDTTFELLVDMSKLVTTELKYFYTQGGSYGEGFITGDDVVDLTGYKPYVIALGQEQFDSDNYVFTAWSADIMKMTSTDTFPTDPVKAAPKLFTCYDLTHIAGNATIDENEVWNHVALDGSNSYDFTYTYYGTGEYGDVYDAFKFTSGTWDFQAGGVQISALDTQFELYNGYNADNITFVDGLLTVGEEYTITLIVKGDNVAYVKVTAKE